LVVAVINGELWWDIYKQELITNTNDYFFLKSCRNFPPLNIKSALMKGNAQKVKPI
jgi:hypothetical protein